MIPDTPTTEIPQPRTPRHAFLLRYAKDISYLQAPDGVLLDISVIDDLEFDIDSVIGFIFSDFNLKTIENIIYHYPDTQFLAMRGNNVNFNSKFIFLILKGLPNLRYLSVSCNSCNSTLITKLLNNHRSIISIIVNTIVATKPGLFTRKNWGLNAKGVCSVMDITKVD